MSQFDMKPKNYLTTSIYILSYMVVDNSNYKTRLKRKPFATLELAKEDYSKACVNYSHAMLQKLTVRGTPRGVALAMFELGKNQDVGASSDDVFGKYVEHIAFETVTEQAGAL